MSRPEFNPLNNSSPTSSTTAGNPASTQSNSSPLVIVSEQGRHSQESRRIVRAQAARASAAQSRVTRARNREEREGVLRETPHPSPVTSELRSAMSSYDLAKQSVTPVMVHGERIGGGAGTRYPPSVAMEVSLMRRPLLQWLSDRRDPSLVLGTSHHFNPPPPLPDVALRLPVALPRGFVSLQQRVDVCPQTLSLLSRTSCVDYASPGVEQRLVQLLHDTIRDSSPSPAGHPVQSHLLLACVCLVIFQGQRADGRSYVDHTLQEALEAAGAEAIALDINLLADPKVAEAALWAIFMICVTTHVIGATYSEMLRTLLRDMQLAQWDQVRHVLLDFIYPVSFIDDACKRFYHELWPAS